MYQKRIKDKLIAGRHPVAEALEDGVPVDKVMLHNGIRGDFEKEIRYLCRSRNIPLQVVPKERLSKVYGGNHQGIVAIGTEVQFQQLEHILPHLYEQGKVPRLALLDGITDVRNFGAIARSAEVFGIHAIIISAKKSASANSVAVKASAGALLRIPVCREKSMSVIIQLLQDNGIQLVGADGQSDKKVDEIEWRKPVAIVLGDEGEGISSTVRKSLSETCAIPQLGKTDSLNVSVAAGVIFYEAMKGNRDE